MLKFAVMKRKQHVSHAKLFTWAAPVVIAAILLAFASEAGAQNRDKQRRAQVDSMLAGKYHDYEFNFRSYGKRFGFDFVYQDAKNFSGRHEHEGLGRIDLPADILSVKTLNMNAFYVFNHRRFSYPAAFSQSYIQRRSAGSFLVTLSAQGQHANLDGEQSSDLKMTNIGIGGGYGYNYVPSKGWLLHISAQPTFIVYSKTSLTFNDTSVPLRYHFPEVIITGRSAVVKLI